MAFLHSVNVDGEQGLLRIKKKLDKSIKKNKYLHTDEYFAAKHSQY